MEQYYEDLSEEELHLLLAYNLFMLHNSYTIAELSEYIARINYIRALLNR